MLLRRKSEFLSFLIIPCNITFAALDNISNPIIILATCSFPCFSVITLLILLFYSFFLYMHLPYCLNGFVFFSLFLFYSFFSFLFHTSDMIKHQSQLPDIDTLLMKNGFERIQVTLRDRRRRRSGEKRGKERRKSLGQLGNFFGVQVGGCLSHFNMVFLSCCNQKLKKEKKERLK